MDNYRGTGVTITVAPSRAVKAGEFFFFHGVPLVAATNAAAGQPVSCFTQGVFKFASAGAGLEVHLSSEGLNVDGVGGRVGTTTSGTEFLFHPAAGAAHIGGEVLSKLKPVGFNYYSLVSEIIYGVGGLATIRPANLQYIKNCGANLVRVAFSVYDAPSLLSRVHSTVSMPSRVENSNLRPSFIAACDTAMAALAQYGFFCHVNILWGQDTVSTAFSEGLAESTLPGSKTRAYSESMAEWVCGRYFGHPAFGYLSIGNEYVTDEAGVSAPTTAQLADFFAAVAQAAKNVSPGVLVTADISSPPINLARTKPTVEQTMDKFRALYAALDFYCIHIYNEDYSFTGHCVAEGVGVANNAVYSPLGYEGVASLMQAYSDMAAADNKKLIVGEFGINEDNETSDPANTHYDTKKKRRFFKAVIPNATCSLVWNVQDTTQAGTAGNQSIWCIDPAITTNKRKDDFLAICKAYNYGKPGGLDVGAVNPARRLILAPERSVRIPNRTAGYNVRMTSTAAHQSSSGYSIAFWLKLDAPLNNAETVMDLRGAGNLSGLIVLGLLQSNALSIYMDGRYASGSAGNTSNALKDFAVGEWNHIVINTVSRTINAVAVSYAEIWLNGLYWHSVNMTAAIAAIPVGTTLYVIGGNVNGVPVRMQDVALFPSALSNAEVWQHIKREVSPRALYHIRAMPDGQILDVSKNAVALTVTGAIMREES